MIFYELFRRPTAARGQKVDLLRLQDAHNPRAGNRTIRKIMRCVVKLKLKDIRPNPFRDLVKYPIPRAKIDFFISSYKATTFWENIVVRKNGKEWQLAFGHARYAALVEMFGGKKKFDFRVRQLTDGQMVRCMFDENADMYGGHVQPFLQSVRAAIKAYAGGRITTKEMPQPKIPRDQRFAPSFQIAVPKSGTAMKFPYNVQTLAQFLGQVKTNGDANYKVECAIDALALNEAGGFPDDALDKFENWDPLQKEIEARTEKRHSKENPVERREEEKEEDPAEENDNLTAEEAKIKRVHTFKLEIIKTGYLVLAKRYHPDKKDGDKEAMMDLNVAKDEMEQLIGTVLKKDLVKAASGFGGD
jgi:hypothetical protein